jgi:hypothetical protein
MYAACTTNTVVIDLWINSAITGLRVSQACHATGRPPALASRKQMSDQQHHINDHMSDMHASRTVHIHHRMHHNCPLLQGQRRKQEKQTQLASCQVVLLNSFGRTMVLRSMLQRTINADLALPCAHLISLSKSEVLYNGRLGPDGGQVVLYHD